MRDRTLQHITTQRVNANKHTPRGMGELEKSIGERGWIGAITAAADGEVFDGSARREVLETAGLEDPIFVETDGSRPVVLIRTDIPTADDPRAKQLAVEANFIAAHNFAADADVLVGLKAELDLSGLIRPEEWDALLATSPPEPGAGGDEGEEPNFDAPTEVQSGDIWQVGPHTVACLSSTVRENVERLARGVTFVVADPPYGVDIVAADVPVGGGERYDYPFGGVKNRLGSVGGAKPFGSKATRGSDGAANVLPVGKYMPVIGDDTTDTAIDAALLALDLFPKATQFWFGANYYAHALPPSSCWIVWDKENTGNFADAELAWSNHDSVVRIFKHMWNGMLRASERERRTHPTQKPQALFQWLYEKYGKIGDIILDPFLGSGPSLKAAQRLGRTVIGFELSPHYCDHILAWGRAEGLTCVRQQ